ncbi:hypothetical protein GQR58_030489 [Nymphon striatum]|nr:hypothetical protein GQR58_030489 [Nymphon striatum]
MVTPARATRRRTPGGSSIWPNTKAAFDSTVAASSPAPILVSPISMKRSMTFTPVSNICDDGSSESNDGAGRWILPPFGDVDFALVDVERFTDYVPDVTQGDIAERHH